jgi:hypothetical protein
MAVGGGERSIATSGVISAHHPIALQMCNLHSEEMGTSRNVWWRRLVTIIRKIDGKLRIRFNGQQIVLCMGLSNIRAYSPTGHRNKQRERNAGKLFPSD